MTALEAARRSGRAKRTVCLWCQRNDVERLGGVQYMITEEQYARMVAETHEGPGRPQKKQMD